MAGAVRDHERVMSQTRAQGRERDSLGQQLPLVAQEAHRVLGEGLERRGHAPLLVGKSPLEVALRQHVPLREPVAVAVEPGAAHGHELAVGELLEQLRAGSVDQADPATDELERPGIRKAPGR